ncbi:hypothetical protein EMCRGX_G017412 [Ephydatia muelleri]
MDTDVAKQDESASNATDQVTPDQEVDPCPRQTGYTLSVARAALCYTLAILPLCGGLLFAYWFPAHWLKLICKKCPLSEARYVIVISADGKQCVEHVRQFSMAREQSLEKSLEESSLLVPSSKGRRLAYHAVSSDDVTNPLTAAKPRTAVSYFIHRYLRYLYDRDVRKFVLLRGLDRGVKCDAVCGMEGGIQHDDHEDRLLQYGPNSIDVPVKPYHLLFVEEVLHPFYIFQILCVTVWLNEQYYYYAGVIVLMSSSSIIASLIQTRRNMQQLHDMVKQNCSVTVIRDGRELHGVSGESLVPGDVMVIPPSGMSMPCDAVLLTGTAIVNEASLTGESVPVMKTQLPNIANEMYHEDRHKRHTLFGGTQVIQTRFYSNSSVLAVVARTGFSTSRGSMVRSILFPKPLNFKFYLDAIKFVLLLSVVALIGFCYTLTILGVSHYDIRETIIRAFDVITIVVPPALPAALTVGTVYALQRLKKQQIYCISPQRCGHESPEVRVWSPVGCGHESPEVRVWSPVGCGHESPEPPKVRVWSSVPRDEGCGHQSPRDEGCGHQSPEMRGVVISPQRVNVCGKIKLVCFDKTGTLTEDSLDMEGVITSTNQQFSPMVTDPSSLLPCPLLYGMTTCHSLTRINGQLLGDPLDVKMFNSTGWTLEEPGEDTSRFDMIIPTIVKPPLAGGQDGVELGIMKQFTFSSELQRMSVLIKTLPSHDPKLFHVYVKGAPEKIRKLCRPETVPEDFFDVLSSFTQKGMRVLAVGHRTMQISWHKTDRIERDMVECDLEFSGLIIMKNSLKPETTPVISVLKNANIRTVMVTGDNLLTAVSVARECGMVEPDHQAIMVKADSTSATPSVTFHLLKEGSNLAFLFQSTQAGNLVESQQISHHHETQLDKPFSLVIDGRSFDVVRSHFPDLIPKLLVKGTVFARMSPDQKAQLVIALQGLGYGVGMCGDGANDCGALKAAHAGISLSEAEASVASPFTSKVPNITCVPKVIMEGRAALTTSFSVFKFMALYSLTQFMSAAILYAFESNLGDRQYFYIDFFIILSFAFVMGLTRPYPHLAKLRPPGTLAGLDVFFSIFTHAGLILLFQVASLLYLQERPWYKPLVAQVKSQNIVGSENTVVFQSSIFQYVSLAVGLSTGPPYRKPLYTNALFVLCLLVLSPCNVFLILAPSSWVPGLWSLLQLIPHPYLLFRVGVLELAILFMVITLTLESFVFHSRWFHAILRVVRCKRSPSNLYKRVLKEIQPSWPPLGVKIPCRLEKAQIEPLNSTYDDTKTDFSGTTPFGKLLVCLEIMESGSRDNSRQSGPGDPSSRRASSSHLLKDEELDPCPPQGGYAVSIIKHVVLYPLAILPLFTGLLFAYWFPAKWVKLTCRKCHLGDARYVIVKDLDGKECVEVVHRTGVQHWGGGEEEPLLARPRPPPLMYLIHRHLRYVYSEVDQEYLLLGSKEAAATCHAHHDMQRGLLSREHADRLILYGANNIDVPVKSYPKLFFEEVLHPFYIFQILSIALWMYEKYFYYAGVIVLMSSSSIIASLIQTRRNMQQLHDMVKQNCSVTVIRDGRELHGVSGESLVPGDVMVIPPSGMSMPCDAVLLTGTAIVNEASLTGESVPITKTPIPETDELYRPDRHKRHTLFGGTHVIQTKSLGSALAVVVRTGFYTSKGGMVRSILFPRPLNFRFYMDAIKFVLVLGVVALAGCVYTLIILNLKHYELNGTIVRALDVFVIVVPPALPAALTVGTVYALQRLKKQQIYCISPQRVNLCGKIKLVCFDKTGTLTEDSLDMASVICASGQRFHPPTPDPSSLLPCPLLYGMTTCHSLTLINGQLLGDPLDVKMFNSTGWTLEEPGEDTSRFDMIIPTIVKPPLAGGQDGVELGIMKQFTFSSELQRMSVLVKTLPSHDPKLFHVYVKGAPEKIRKLCRPETVPEDFFDVLSSFTQKGMRVLAVGHRTMITKHELSKIERDMVECDLEFSGLIIMKNSLKPETTPVISVLKNANIRTVMVTGDNLLTAVSVARECGMIEPDHQAIMVKADSTSATPSVTFHLLQDGKDLSNIMLSNDVGHAPISAHPSPLLSDEVVPKYVEEDGWSQNIIKKYHIVVNGTSFAVIRAECPDLLPKLLVKGTVFARMSPDQKAQLVTDLQGLGYGVGMCGDGANDCGALKAAHAGISLSEAEASVASPFTSKVPNITCVPKVIMEGRAALTTSFSVFKYMALYSLTQFMSAAILYAFESNLGDAEYFYIDFFLILSCVFVMGLTGPYPHLDKRRPPGTLAGVDVFFSVLVHAALIFLSQCGALLYLRSRMWNGCMAGSLLSRYKPLVVNPDSENIACSENTAVFQASIFQYVSLAVTLSVGPPYRKPLYTNWILFPFNAYLTLAPASWWAWLWKELELKPHPYLLFRVGLLELAVVYFAVTYTLEGYFFHSRWLHAVLRMVRCKRSPSNRYKHVLAGIDPSWPPLVTDNSTLQEL